MQNPSPLSAPPSLLSLQSTLQGTVVLWSGVTMSSQHRAVSNLILQLAAQGCIIVAGSGLWGNNDLLRLPIHLFSKHIQWNKHINARDNIVTYASQPLISAGRWKVSLLKWVFPSLQESRSLWIGDGRPRRPLFPLIFFFPCCFGEQFSLTCSWLFYGSEKYIGLFICCNYNNIAIGVPLGNKSDHSFLLYTNN